MKCKKCGAELKEGNLYCESCGEEIKIVPEFDLELDSQLNQTIASMAQDVFDEASVGMDNMTDEETARTTDYDSSFDDIQTDDDELLEDFRDMIPKSNIQFNKNTRKKILLILLGIFVFFFAVIFLISIIRHTGSNSYETQYREAVTSASNGAYEDAVTYMERALAINPANEDAKYLLAGYYYHAGNEKSAVILLQELIIENVANIDDVYDTLISIYEEQQDYQAIHDLLLQCHDDVILSKYNQYIAREPIFNQPEGEYDRIISITLSGNTDGVIHYTMDGTTPSRQSLVYDGTPILLDSGVYTIRAIFTNAYDVDSEVAVMQYRITIQPPDAPEISLESGNYSVPQLIEVIYSPDTKVFYTTNGTVPDANSQRYTEPLEMPVGISNFHFVAINDAGAASDIVQRSFQFNLESYLTPEIVLQVLLNNLQVKGIILNQNGNVPDRLGHNTYVVHSAVQIDGSMYYIIIENYVDTTGSIHEAQSYYAINAATGDPYYAWKIGEGQYTLREL